MAQRPDLSEPVRVELEALEPIARWRFRTAAIACSASDTAGSEGMRVISRGSACPTRRKPVDVMIKPGLRSRSGRRSAQSGR